MSSYLHDRKVTNKKTCMDSKTDVAKSLLSGRETERTTVAFVSKILPGDWRCWRTEAIYLPPSKPVLPWKSNFKETRLRMPFRHACIPTGYTIEQKTGLKDTPEKSEGILPTGKKNKFSSKR